MEKLYIGADNSIILDGLRDSATHAYIADATIRFTLFRQWIEDGTMSAGSAVLTSEAGEFVAGDASKSIIVPGAGAQRSDLRTTISSRDSSTQLTLATAATYAVTYSRVFVSVPAAKDVLMPYVGANGKYRGTLDSAVALSDGELYRLSVSIDAGSDREDFRELILSATYRKAT